MKKFKQKMKLNKVFLNKLKYSNIKKEFIEGLLLKDVLIFLAFPIFISFLMFLPLSFRELLAFKIYDYSWWQFMTHAFIHKDFNHLLLNLQGYFIIGIFLLVFANKIKEKKKLLLLSLFTFVSLPIISSIVLKVLYPIVLPGIKVSQGSSGLVSAMLGFLPMFWVYYVSIRNKKKFINLNFYNLAIFYVFLLFVIIYYPFHKNVLFVLFSLILFILFGLMYKKNLGLVVKSVIEEFKESLVFGVFLVLSLFLFMVMPLVLFPVELIQGQNMVDFFTHYVGLVYGMVVSFLFFRRKI